VNGVAEASASKKHGVSEASGMQKSLQKKSS
jgi:hypothetical protein